MDTVLLVLACLALFVMIGFAVVRRTRARKGNMPKDIYPHW